MEYITFKDAVVIRGHQKEEDAGLLSQFPVVTLQGDGCPRALLSLFTYPPPRALQTVMHVVSGVLLPEDEEEEDMERQR